MQTGEAAAQASPESQLRSGESQSTPQRAPLATESPARANQPAAPEASTPPRQAPSTAQAPSTSGEGVSPPRGASRSLSPTRIRPRAPQATGHDLGRVAAAGVALIRSSLSGYSDAYVTHELSLMSESVAAFFAEAATQAKARAREVQVQLERTVLGVRDLALRLGVNQTGLASFDGGLCVDVRLSLAEKELQELTKARDERAARLAELQARIFALLAEFGAPEEAKANYVSLDGDLTPRRVDFFAHTVEQLQIEREARKEEVRALADHLRALVLELDGPDELVQEALEKAARASTEAAAAAAGVSDTGLLALRGLVTKWRSERSARIARLEALAARVRSMWDSLGMPASRREAFTGRAASAPLAYATLRAHEEEMKSLEEEQRARLADTLAAARSELDARWDEMSLEESARKKFDEAYCRPGEDLQQQLDAIRLETSRCEAMLRRMRPIFELMERREALEGMREEYLRLISQPERLTTKARRHDLIAEERLRTAVERQLPRLKTKLAAAIERWEAEHECYFVVDGRRYLDMMREEEEDELRAREEAKSLRSRRPSALPAWEPGPGRDRLQKRAPAALRVDRGQPLSRSLDFSSRPSASPVPSEGADGAGSSSTGPPSPDRVAALRASPAGSPTPGSAAGAKARTWGPPGEARRASLGLATAALTASGELLRGPRAGIGGRSSGLMDWERSWRPPPSPDD